MLRFVWLVAKIAKQVGSETEAESIVVEWLGPEARLVQSW